MREGRTRGDEEYSDTAHGYNGEKTKNAVHSGARRLDPEARH